MIDIYSNIENIVERIENTIDKKELNMLIHYLKQLLIIFKDKCFLESKEELSAFSTCLFAELSLCQSKSYASYLTTYYLYEVVMEVLNDEYIHKNEIKSSLN